MKNLKKYISLEELKKDYPIGKIEVYGKEESYSCPKNSKLFKDFISFFENNPSTLKKIEDENGITYSIKHTNKLYEIIDYVYVESRSIWFPVDGTKSDISIYEYIEGFCNFPLSYEETINNIKELNYIISEDTVNNELHSKH